MSKDIENRLLLPKNLIAKSFGISVQAVSNWDINPHKKQGCEALYYLPDVIEYIQGRDEDKSDYLELTRQKTRKEKEMADKLEMENNLRRGQLVEAKDVQDALIEFVTLSKNKLLGVRARINRIIVACAGVNISIQNQKKIEKGVDKEIRNTLSELAGLNKLNSKNN